MSYALMLYSVRFIKHTSLSYSLSNIRSHSMWAKVCSCARMCMSPFACIILWQCEGTVIIKRDYLGLVSGFSPKVIIVQAAWSILTLYGQQKVLQLRLTLPDWQAKRMHYKKCTRQRQTHNIIQLSGKFQIYNRFPPVRWKTFVVKL